MSLRWRWPADTALQRRERVAQTYRAALAIHAPEICAELDGEMLRYGQRWVVPVVVSYTDDDLLSAELAADYAGVSVKTIYEWHQRGLGVKTVDGIRFPFAQLRAWRSR